MNKAVCLSNDEEDLEKSDHMASVIKLQKHMMETTFDESFKKDWMDILFSKINIYNLTIIERSTKLLEVLQSFCMRRP